MLNISRVGSRLAATYHGCETRIVKETFRDFITPSTPERWRFRIENNRQRLAGGANENPQRVEDTLWMGASETRLLW